MNRQGQLLISDSATIILPYHKSLDQAREQALGNEKIGTTGKGIGPAYEDRASRRAILFQDIFSPSTLRKKIETALSEKNYLLEKYGKPTFTVDEIYNLALKCAEILKPYRCQDSSNVIYNAMQSKKRVLFEGAQGILLDMDFGFFPNVTRSNTTSKNALSL